MNEANDISDLPSQDSHRRSDADPLEKALRRIRRTREFPTISKYVVEINQKLLDTSVHASASELANIILKDYALTNKLLKLVNSAFYGFVAGKVTTVTRAVVLLGQDNVRLAALSLVLFDHFKSKTAVTDLKEATIRSFWCGLVAKEIARRQHGVDQEEAFICGLLHQLGRLLAIYHMPRDYREIQYRVLHQGKNEAHAAKQIIGVSYRSLGVAVARQWNFPESIYRTMASISVDDLEDKGKRIDPLWAVASFANALAIIYSEVPPGRQGSAIDALLSRYQHYVALSAKSLKALVADCLDQLCCHAEALQFDVADSEFLSQLCGKSADRPKPALKCHAGDVKDNIEPVFHLMGDEDLKGAAIDPAGQDAAAIIMGGIQELSSAMLGQFDLNDMALMSLEVMYRALQCRRAILFINERRNRVMEARFGYGEGIQEMTGNIQFKIDASDDLFNQAIRAGKDLLVEDAHAPELFAMIPEWYRQGIDARAFIFLPVVFKQVCVGAYYADLAGPGTPINSLEHRYLSMLRNQLVLAIKMGR